MPDTSIARRRSRPTSAHALRPLRLRPTLLLALALGAVCVVLVTAGASAAIETRTVHSYWRGLWWSLSLITTVGFIGKPPETEAGAALSALLMVVGFALLAMVSALLAALFIRDAEEPEAATQDEKLERLLTQVGEVGGRLDRLERLLYTDRLQRSKGACEP